MSEDTILIDDRVLSVKTKKSKVAMFGLAVTGGLAIGLSVVTASFVSPALRRICLPYVPATEKQIANVLKLCKQCKGERNTLVDLGSGDGRIVFAAANHGYLATGYELNPWLVFYSKLYARFNGLSGQAYFKRQDLWKSDLTKFDNIVIFGVAEMMDELSVKLEAEMSDSTRIIACRFPVKRWSAVEVIEEGIDSVWMYTKDSFRTY